MQLAPLRAGMSEVLRILKWHACPHGSNPARFTRTLDPPLSDPLASDVAMLQYTSVGISLPSVRLVYIDYRLSQAVIYYRLSPAAVIR
jgi:hypothetical protein